MCVSSIVSREINGRLVINVVYLDQINNQEVLKVLRKQDRGAIVSLGQEQERGAKE